MKKKSLFSGFGAKFALIALALSSTFMTGCYKDEGLDVIDPDGDVVLPAAKYTITGTVVDSETQQLIADATVNGVPTKKGSYTIEVDQPGDIEVTAAATGYTSQTTTVSIKQLNAGQSAVYPVFFSLAKVSEAQKEVPVLYDLTVNVWDEDMKAINDANVVVYNNGSVVSDLKKLPAGTYTIKASKEGFVTSVQYLTLENKKVLVAADYKEDYVLVSKVSDLVLLKDANATTKVVVSGKLKFADRWMLAKVIEMYNQDGKLLGQASNTYAYRFEVNSDEFTAVTKAETVKKLNAKFLVIDENGIEFKYNVTYNLPELGESASTEIVSNVRFDAYLNLVDEEGTVETQDTDEYDPAIVNSSEYAKNYKYQWNALGGTVLVKDNVNESLIKTSPLAIAVADAYETYSLPFQVFDKHVTVPTETKFTLPAYTGVKSVDRKHTKYYQKLIVNNITVTTSVNDANAETVNIELPSAISTIEKRYESMYSEILKFNMFSVSHDHGHGHGHGDIDHTHGHGHGHGHGADNAGGGIIDAL